MPTLREFTEAHVIGAHLTLDWTQDEATLPALVSQAAETLATELPTREMTAEERKATADALGYWYDDLRRCHLMANPLAVQEFLEACPDDNELLAAFADRDDREKGLWMFAFRDKAVLQLFGEHIVHQEIKPEEIEPKRYRLNALRDGLEPFEDWSSIGVQKVRLRRATFARKGGNGITFSIEGPEAKDQPDAIAIAREGLKVTHSFEAEYDLEGATVLVYADGKGKRDHFSFKVYASGSSTIKNLSVKNQPLALAVLKALNVIDAEEPIPDVVSEDELEAVAA
jgi:hypothetical protein